MAAVVVVVVVVRLMTYDYDEDPIVAFVPTTAPPLLAFRLLLRTLGTLSLSKLFCASNREVNV